METISWPDFEKIELRAGTVVEVKEFPEARKPAYKLKIDFGEEIGIKQASAQVTVNFPPKQIGPFVSECLVTGLYKKDGSVVLAIPEQPVQDGARLG
jgi:tRNA-binding protein